MSLTDDERRGFLDAWLSAGQKLLDDPRLDSRALDLIKAAALPRLLNALPATGVGLGIPCKDTLTQDTFLSACELVHWFGLTPDSKQGFEVANNRQSILDKFLQSPFRRLLFLDSDTMVDGKGFWQLMTTMDRWRCAMVAALVPMRYTGADGRRLGDAEYNAYLETAPGNYVPVKREHIPQSKTAFTVHHCGFGVALIDLDKIRDALRRGPGDKGPLEEDFCFKRFAEGPTRHVGEDTYFCQWLREHDLDFVVDPKVATVHVPRQRLGYLPDLAPPPAEG